MSWQQLGGATLAFFVWAAQASPEPYPSTYRAPSSTPVLEAVLQIIMDSNASKLGADGKPIYDANGKFLKGPNYWKPEPKIRELLG